MSVRAGAAASGRHVAVHLDAGAMEATAVLDADAAEGLAASLVGAARAVRAHRTPGQLICGDERHARICADRALFTVSTTDGHCNACGERLTRKE